MWVEGPVTPRQEAARAANPDGFRPGQKVQHATFGTGVVLSAQPVGDDTQYSVAFPNCGVKKLLQSFAKLQKV
jgi:DNA helicase-2/ATP-dependent DNA helicase PcrA